MSGAKNIETWLTALGLGAYAQAFVDNDIDLDLISDLTVEDLRDIGISSVGHRRKILSAAAELATTQTAQNQSVPVNADDEPGLAERRVLTVMFCDLVDSTSLSAASDAEDFREFIAQFRQDVETAIRPFGGTVSQFLGDGVMASFGYPRASGHDAERAVAAGLAVIDRVKRLPDFAGKPPQVRIGIATGLTVVGAIDSGVSLRDESAIGDTPNLASRLQDHAEPNTMIIARQTRELIGKIFDCEKLGEVPLKGFVTPVAAWKVLGRGSTASRYEAMRTNSRSHTFIGRKDELRTLADHCNQMRAGSGRLLVVEGETGIGKSCLVQQGLSALSPKVADPVVLQCSPYSVNMQFFAVRYFIAPALGDLNCLDHIGVRKWLSGFGHDSDEAVALIVSLMAVSEDQTVALDAYSSDQIRAKIFDLLFDVLRKIIISSGAIIIEDIQWIDPSTAELIQRLLSAISQGEAIMLATSHPVVRGEWLDAIGAQTLHLKRLPQEDLRHLVGVLSGDAQLSEDVIDTIVDRSDGVPIFAEELAIGFLESSALESSRRVPMSLSESLLARLDRLVNGKRIASLAAAIGRETPLSLLIASSDLPASVVHTGIGELLDAGIIVPSHTIFGESIRFRHGLVREAAYDLLLRRQRKTLHNKIAETVTDRFPDLVENRPHMLAIQWFHAEQLEKAVAYWLRAGQLETDRSAYGEALAYFDRAFEVNETIPPSTARTEVALDILLNRMNARICLFGFLEANEAETAAIAKLVKDLGSSAKALTALNLRWVYLLTVDNAEASRDFAFQIRDNEIAKTPSEKLIVLRMCATSLLFCGQLDSAREFYLEFLDSYDPEFHGEDMKEGHSDHSVIVMMGLAEAYTLTGELKKAQEWGDRSIKAARVSHRQHDLAHTLTFAGLLHPYFNGDNDLVAKSIQELDAIVSENPLANWTGFPDLFQGLLNMQEGDFENAWINAKRASDALIQSQRYGNWWQVLYADLCMTTGHWDEAIKMIDLVRPYLDTTEIRFKAEFFRLLGKLYRDRYGDTEAANKAFHAGLEVAKKHGAHLFARAILKEINKEGLRSA
jgi:class 3 adenylate cyclase/tetratricopeptide (TPR) repeat protein